MKKYLLFLLVAATMVASSCGSSKPVSSTVAYQNHPTECIGADPSGSVRLRVWGEGRDEKGAIENARKKAVEEVLFNHITAGSEKGHSWPLIDNPSVRRTQSAYFAKFFKDGGNYKKYIKMDKPEKEAFHVGNDKVVVPVEIIVDKEGLRKKMTKDKILK